MTKFPLSSQDTSKEYSNRYILESTPDPIVNGSNLKKVIKDFASFSNFAIFISPGVYDLNGENIVLQRNDKMNLIGLGNEPEDHTIFSSYAAKGSGVFAIKTKSEITLKNLNIENRFAYPYTESNPDEWQSQSAWHLINFTPSGAFTRCAISQNSVNLTVSGMNVSGINGYYSLEVENAEYDRTQYESKLVWTKIGELLEGAGTSSAPQLLDTHLALNVNAPLEIGNWEFFKYQNNTKSVLAQSPTSPNFFRWPWEIISNSWQNNQNGLVQTTINILLDNNKINMDKVGLGSSDLCASMRSNMPYFGTFKNVKAGFAAFGGVEGYVSGHLENCQAGDYSFGSRLYDPRPWPTSKSSFTDGTFINCTAATFSFGAEGYIRGNFINCSAGHSGSPELTQGEPGILTGNKSSMVNYKYITS